MILHKVTRTVSIIQNQIMKFSNYLIDALSTLKCTTFRSASFMSYITVYAILLRLLYTIVYQEKEDKITTWDYNGFLCPLLLFSQLYKKIAMLQTMILQICRFHRTFFLVLNFSWECDIFSGQLIFSINIKYNLQSSLDLCRCQNFQQIN